jgi:hypothetical protein
VLHGAPALNLSSVAVLPHPDIPRLGDCDANHTTPVVYTLAFWHADDDDARDEEDEREDDAYDELFDKDDPRGCGMWSVLLERGHSFPYGRRAAPSVMLHRRARRLAILHASARDGDAHIMTRRGAHPARAWNHVGVVANRTTLTLYTNGTLAYAIGLEDGDALTWGFWSVRTPLHANAQRCGRSGLLRGVVWANAAASQAEVRRVMQLSEPEAAPPFEKKAEPEPEEEEEEEEEEDDDWWWRGGW